MKKLERILVISSVLFLVIRLFIITDLNWPYVLSSFLLIYLYGLGGVFLFNSVKIKDLFKGSSWTKRIFGSIGISMVYVMAVGGVTAKVYSAPGASFMTYVSAFFLLVVASPVVYKKSLKNDYYKQFIPRNVVLLILLAIMILTPMETRIKILYKDYPVLIEKYLRYMDDPSDNELWKEVQKEKEKI